MRVIFAGGGSGGHIYPALAVAEEIVNKRPDTEILFMAGSREIERKIYSETGFTYTTIPVIGFPRKVSPALIPFVWKLWVSVIKSRHSMKNFNPSVMMATGGYIAGPPIIAAVTMGIPVVIQEQNSFPGITNRKLARFADIVFLGFYDAGKYLSDKLEIIVTGNPVRREIGKGIRDYSAEKFGLNPSSKTVLILGGSQGSHALNSVVSQSAERIAQREIQMLWVTGNNEYARYSHFDGMNNGNIRVISYIDDMVSAYAAADMVVSRAGAMAIAEMTVCGLPAVLVPLPTAAKNHQEYNAQSMVNSGAAVMILERELTTLVLEREITNIITSKEKLAAMTECSKKMGNKDAARNIAEVLIARYGMN